MKYKIITPKKFQKKLDKCAKRGLDLQKIKDVIAILANGMALPSQYRPHKLSGSYAGCWECHIQGDWVLVWQQDDEELILLLLDTGSHSDLF